MVVVAVVEGGQSKNKATTTLQGLKYSNINTPTSVVFPRPRITLTSPAYQNAARACFAVHNFQDWEMYLSRVVYIAVCIYVGIGIRFCAGELHAR